MSTRTTRSRITSPSQGQGQVGNATGTTGGNGASKSIANGGSRSFMQRWLEPEVQSKASFEEHGLVRCGVVETMLPLGALPKVAPKKRPQSNMRQRNSTTPNASGSRPGGSGKNKQPVRKIILHPPASASKSKRTSDDYEGGRDHVTPVSRTSVGPGEDVEMFSDLPVKTTSRRPGAHKDLAPDEDDDDDYRPTAKKSKSGSGAGHAGGPNYKRTGGAVSASSGSASSVTQTPMLASMPAHDAASLGAASETPTPSLRKSSKRAAASAATVAAAKSASLEAAAETMRTLLQKAENQGRHTTARALQMLYNENSGDMELLEIIDKIYSQRSRQSDSAMWARFDRLIEERRREQRENSTEMQGLDYNDSDSDMEADNGKSVLEKVMRGGDYGDGHFTGGDTGTNNSSGAAASGIGARNRRAGNSRDVGAAGAAATERGGSLSLAPGAGSSGRNSGTTKKKNGNTRELEHEMAHKSTTIDERRPSSSESHVSTTSTRKIKLKSNRQRQSPSSGSASVELKMEEDAEEAADNQNFASPTPVRRIVAFSSSAQKASAKARVDSDNVAAAAAAAATTAAAATAATSAKTKRRSRSLSVSSDSSLSSLSSVELDDAALVSDEDGDAACGGPGTADLDDQPIMDKDGPPANQNSARHNNKAKSKDASVTTTPSITITTSGSDPSQSKHIHSTSSHNGAGSSKQKSKKGSATPPSSSNEKSSTIVSFFRRATELHQQLQAKVESVESAAPSNATSVRASPAASLAAAQIEEAEKAKLDSVDDLRQACIRETATRTSCSESSVRGHTNRTLEADGFGFRLRPLPPAKPTTVPTITSIEVDEDSVMAKKKTPSLGTDSSLSSLSSVSSSNGNVTGGRATRASLKRSHDGDETMVDVTPPRQATKTPPRAVTPSLPPSKKQRTGPRVKLSPKKGTATTTGAGIPRPSSRGEPESGPSQDNDDFCSACGASGELLCCDNCVKAFHFGCIDVESEKLPDQWFCWECRVIRAPSTLPLSPTINAFSILEFVLERNNPRAYRLPPAIQTYFEGIKAAADGTYEDIVPPTKKRDRKNEETIDWYKIRDNDSAILCKACHQSADNIRPIIPCSKCGIYWHLDCLDEPLAVPPVLKTWSCPLHVEDDALAMIVSGPAHRYRKVRNAPAITPMFSRSNHNNGILELEDDLDEYMNEYEKNIKLSRASGWADPETFGRTYRLKSSAVMNDFIDRVYATKRPATLREKKLKRALQEQIRAEKQARSAQSMTAEEVEAVFTLALIPTAQAPMCEAPKAAPLTPQQYKSKSSAPRIPASPAPTQSPKTESECDPPLSTVASPQPQLDAKESDVLALITGMSTTSIANGGVLSDAARHSLRSAMAQIQLILGDEAPTPPLDPAKSLPPSPMPMPPGLLVKRGQVTDGADAVMMDLSQSELSVEGDKNEPATVSPEVEEPRSVGKERGRGVVIVDEEGEEGL